MKIVNWMAAALMSMGLASAMAADEPAAPPVTSEAAAAPAPAPLASEPAPAAAAAPSVAPVSATPASPATGTIIFFRPRKFVGAAIGFIVREGTTELGKLRNGNFFSIQAPVGVHHYVVHSETKDELTIEVEAGETYYVSGSLGMGLLAGRPNLSPSDAAAYEAAKGSLKESKPLQGEKSGD